MSYKLKFCYHAPTGIEKCKNAKSYVKIHKYTPNLMRAQKFTLMPKNTQAQNNSVKQIIIRYVYFGSIFLYHIL